MVLAYLPPAEIPVAITSLNLLEIPSLPSGDMTDNLDPGLVVSLPTRCKSITTSGLLREGKARKFSSIL